MIACMYRLVKSWMRLFCLSFEELEKIEIEMCCGSTVRKKTLCSFDVERT